MKQMDAGKGLGSHADSLHLQGSRTELQLSTELWAPPAPLGRPEHGQPRVLRCASVPEDQT